MRAGAAAPAAVTGRSNSSPTNSLSRSSNVIRPAVPPNSSSTTARWLRPRCISSIRSAACIAPAAVSGARTGTGLSGWHDNRSSVCATPITWSSEPR